MMPGVRGKLAGPGFGLSIVLSVMVVGLQTILSVPLAVIDLVAQHQLHMPPPHLERHPLTIGIVNIVAFSACLAVGLLVNRLSFRRAFPWVRITASQVAAAAILIIGCDILLSEADNLFRALAPPPKFLADLMKELFSFEGNPAEQVFLLVLVAPITEELLFRGIILRGLLSRTRPAFAVLVSALLFALVHLNPWQFISALCLGLVLGWAYLRTGSVLLCILGHAISNGLMLLCSVLPVRIPGMIGTPDFTLVEFQPWWLDSAGAVVLALGLWLFRRATAQPLQDESSAPPASPLPGPPPSALSPPPPPVIPPPILPS